MIKERFNLKQTCEILSKVNLLSKLLADKLRIKNVYINFTLHEGYKNKLFIEVNFICIRIAVISKIFAAENMLQEVRQALESLSAI